MNAVAGVALVFPFAAACSSSHGPRITSVTPMMVAQGGAITVDGEGLCGASGDCATAAVDIQLGTNSPFFNAPPQSYTATEIQAILPPELAVGTTQLVITVNGLASNGVELDVVAP